MSSSGPHRWCYLQAIHDSLAGADLLVSALYAAVTHYKRASVALPFPSELFSTGSEKDYDAVVHALDALPSLQQLVHVSSQIQPSNPTTDAIKESSHQLLEWLLVPSTRRPTRLRHIREQDFIHQLQRINSGFKWDSSMQSNMPTYIFENMSATAGTDTSGSVIAFHGTSFERLHSIMSTGLQPGSGTRLQRNAAIFGNGVYLSTDYGVAFSFCNPASAWKQSALGWKLRAMLVCQVDATVAAHRPQSDLPPQYLLIERPDAIKITHVLVFCDEHFAPKAGAVQRLGRIDWCMVIVVAYAAILLLQFLLQNRSLRRSLELIW